MNIGTFIHRLCHGFRPAAYMFIPVLKIKDSVADHRTMHNDLDRQLALFLSEEQPGYGVPPSAETGRVVQLPGIPLPVRRILSLPF